MLQRLVSFNEVTLAQQFKDLEFFYLSKIVEKYKCAMAKLMYIMQLMDKWISHKKPLLIKFTLTHLMAGLYTSEKYIDIYILETIT